MMTATKEDNTATKIKKAVRRRLNTTNLVLLVVFVVFILLDVNKGWFGVFGGDNFAIFLAAAITGLAVVVPLRTQRRGAMITFSTLVTSELYRNLSELEYANQELHKDYTQEPPFGGSPTEQDKQTMEMSKVMGVARRFDLAFEDVAYKGMISSRIITDINQSVATPIIEAYTGIATAKQISNHFAEFFSRLMDFENAGMNKTLSEHSRKNQVNPAIERIKEDISVAIKQIEKALEILNNELEKYGQRFKPVYREELLKQYLSDKSNT